MLVIRLSLRFLNTHIKNRLVEVFVVGLYFFFLVFIFGYSVCEFNLAIIYLLNKRKEDGNINPSSLELDSEIPSQSNQGYQNEGNLDLNIPKVTVQLPVYNERYVIERLIDAVSKFDYPRDRFEIQVLDDSTDETVQIIAAKVRECQSLGVDIQHVRREDRKGFKAGALAYGMNIAKGEFIAIFDADFVPREDYLKSSVLHFEDDQIGVVQSRWQHLNRDHSLLTKLQAFALDAHFTVEQTGRNIGGHFINFNGTAGIWRRSCIEDAGGWSADTLTEDLDLSYRAQIRGWKFHYIEELHSPAELPITMNALKNQQFRWAKGAAECARKNMVGVFRQKNLTIKTKFHAGFHLFNSFLFVSIVSLAILGVPVIYIVDSSPEYAFLFKFSGLFVISTLFLSFVYFIANYNQGRNKAVNVVQFLLFFPVFLSVSMGLSLYNAVGVVGGYLGFKSAFIRTPKFNAGKQSWRTNKYMVSSVNKVSILEAAIILHSAYGIYSAITCENYGLLVFYLMLAFGFGFTFIYSVLHSRYAR